MLFQPVISKAICDVAKMSIEEFNNCKQGTVAYIASKSGRLPDHVQKKVQYTASLSAIRAVGLAFTSLAALNLTYVAIPALMTTGSVLSVINALFFLAVSHDIWTFAANVQELEANPKAALSSTLAGQVKAKITYLFVQALTLFYKTNHDVAMEGRTLESYRTVINPLLKGLIFEETISHFAESYIKQALDSVLKA